MQSYPVILNTLFFRYCEEEGKTLCQIQQKGKNYFCSLKQMITQTCIILKYLNLNFPVWGIGCMEIITVSCPKVFMGVVSRAINSTAPSLLFLTQQLLNFYNATPLLCSVLEYCLICVAQLVHNRSLSGLHSSSLPSPPTKSLVPTAWHGFPSSHTYTYSLEDVSFGIWLLQSRNIWEGDKNGIRRREPEKLEMNNKICRWNFLSPFYLSPSPEHISSLSSPLRPLLRDRAASEVSNEFIPCPPPTLSAFSEKMFK